MTGQAGLNFGKEAAQQGQLELERISLANGDKEEAGLGLENPEKDDVLLEALANLLSLFHWWFKTKSFSKC